jgi:hypothetical protein
VLETTTTNRSLEDLPGQNKLERGFMSYDQCYIPPPRFAQMRRPQLSGHLGTVLAHPSSRTRVTTAILQ